MPNQHGGSGATRLEPPYTAPNLDDVIPAKAGIHSCRRDDMQEGKMDARLTSPSAVEARLAGMTAEKHRG
jgi:serine/threonine protein kinase HipA of HipAB toxin-antitoxin module